MTLDAASTNLRSVGQADEADEQEAALQPLVSSLSLGVRPVRPRPDRSGLLTKGAAGRRKLHGAPARGSERRCHSNVLCLPSLRC
ncbi:hypothetical protein BOSEA31B_10346 [Hyphomicrobiales bacterium]|nr:hypothetical protein BOSEA31B_10346 [Hyphomicrobiales bacterium]CAH1702027.1 hypothetical protein BOSEA1005_21726 [Hyphomicrobiales bacterium]CAI0346184.1 hypothetical protein BO1005MUT1_470342 [Hyphomicrobiales bacterium]